MTPKLNSELSDALRQQGSPLVVEDEQGQKAYVIVSKEQYRCLLENDFRQWLQIGLDQADRGAVEEWNTDEILAEARRRYLPERH